MELFTSLFAYISIISLSCLFFFIAANAKEKVLKIISLILAISFPVVLAGVRFETGSDYFSYINGYQKIVMGDEVRWEGLEFGYASLNKILAELGVGSQGILFASSLIMFLFITMAIFKQKKYISVGFAALVFLLMFYQSSFNVIRIMIAISIFLYNIPNIEKRNLIKYLFFTILAASFHISALVTLPLYWLMQFNRKEMKLFNHISLYSSVIILILSFNLILEWIISLSLVESLGYYQKYLGNEGGSVSLAIKRVILFTPLLIPGALFYKKLVTQRESFKTYYSILVIGVIIKCIATFQATYMDRIGDYFIITAVIVLPMYFKLFNTKKYYILNYLIVLYLIIYWLYIYFILNNHGTVPYKSIF